jgi:uncharacterized membrane protein
MNEHDHVALEQLKRRQEALQKQLANLSVDIQQLASRLNAAAPPAPEVSPLEISPLESAPQPIAPAPVDTEPAPQTAAVPPPLPPMMAESVAASVPPASRREPDPIESQTRQDAGGTLAPRETFEMKLGTYWLVRIGIVMLLTGLVFLGNYAYKNYFGKLGPPERVALLYTASAALLGLGGWLQRKREKESLRNYGQVLFAGGLAAVYFTTYAAHHVDVLKVITSAALDGSLLLIWAAFTVWIADRRKSEVLALFAIGLSYYTSAITDVGLFTLGSNLLLTAAAVFFLVRNQWTKLSFISVFATYGSFVFWRFHYGGWSWDARVTEVWTANFFLAGYWLFFTAAVFLARGQSMANGGRALFASLNNGAFFALVLLSMMHITHGNFWKFSLGFGSVLLAAMFAARRFLPGEPSLKNAYLVQGLTLITAGLIAYFTGLKVALVLAVESVTLTFLGVQQKNWFVRAGGYITAALSFGWVLDAMSASNTDVALGAMIGLAFLLNAWWEHRNDAQRDSSIIRPGSGYFVALAMAVCAFVTWHKVPAEWLAVAWMIEAVAFTALFYALRISELPLFAQALALAAQAFWFFQFALRAQRPHWLVPAVLVGGTLALSHWWQRQRRLTLPAEGRNLLQIVYALALVGVVFFWFQPKFAPAAWLAFLCAVAVGLTLYGVATRAWALAACAQLFLLISSVELCSQFLREKPPWPFAIVPIATWLTLGVATTAWLSRHDSRTAVRAPLLQVSMFYRGVAFLISLWWIHAYVPVRHWFWVLCLCGVVLMTVAGWLKSREALAFAGAFLAVALAAWFGKVFEDHAVVNWPNALALLCVFVLQQVVRRRPERFACPPEIDSALIVLGGIALWTFVSRWVVLTSGAHFLLTVSWAALAAVLFAAGFALRERMHRWVGLGILASAIGRVFLSDVWKLLPIYRILSFLALGVVLLALGFIYNKYQEKIRQWL